MCLGMQGNTHITGNNLIPIYVHICVDYIVTCIYRCVQFKSCSYLLYLMEGEDRDGYRDPVLFLQSSLCPFYNYL